MSVVMNVCRSGKLTGVLYDEDSDDRDECVYCSGQVCVLW